MSYIDLQPIYDVFERIERLNDDDIWFYSMNQKVKDEIVRMNTIDQLYEKGIDSLGNPITGLYGAEYAPLTVQIKRAKGQRYDHITLRDTGKFYKSFYVLVQKDYFEINADDTSHYDAPLFQVYGEDVAGLTEDNKERLRELILENYINFLRNEIFGI